MCLLAGYRKHKGEEFNLLHLRHSPYILLTENTGGGV